MYTISTTTITRVQVISNQYGDRVEVIIQHAAFLTDIMFRIEKSIGPDSNPRLSEREVGSLTPVFSTSRYY